MSKIEITSLLLCFILIMLNITEASNNVVYCTSDI